MSIHTRAGQLSPNNKFFVRDLAGFRVSLIVHSNRVFFNCIGVLSK